jgi:hypothetical protein
LWRWRVRFAAHGDDVVALVTLSQWLQLGLPLSVGTG